MSAFADTLIKTDLERQFLDALRHASGETDGPMERHCVRCFLFVEALAGKRGSTIDRELVLCCAFMHDAGLYDEISRGGVYTDDSGLCAERMFLDAGATPERAELARETCAQHHALRDQSAKGTEVELMRLADRIELSYGVLSAGLARAQVREIFDRVSRQGTYRVIAGLVGHALLERPTTVPRIFKTN